MALPGVVDPLTGATTPNPLDPTNPASGQGSVPPLIDLSQGVGLTGADAYNVQRLTRAQTYLSGAMQNYPDLAATVGLAPTDWTTLDQHIQALGGQVGYGSGIGQLMDHLMTPGAPKVPVADIGTLQTNLIKQGYMPPGTPVDGVWSSNWAAAMKVADDHNWNASQRGQKPGGASATQFLSWLGDVLPSKVGQALVGTAKFLFGGIAHTAERAAIEFARAPGGIVTGDTQAYQAQTEQMLQARGLETGMAGGTEDLATVLSMLPILRGAGVLQKGISAAATQAGEQGLTTAAEGAVAKGLVSSSVRTMLGRTAERTAAGEIGSTLGGATLKGGLGDTGLSVAEKIGTKLGLMADSPAAVGDLLNSYATRTFGLRSLGEGFLNTADQLAAAKSTALGQGITATLNALTQTAIGERAAANISSGTILPNIKLGKQDRSTLGQAIDNTPALGQAWHIPGLEFLGNPLDLSAFIWAPTKALPIGASPAIGDMANSLDRITPTSDVMPLIRSTGLNRQQLVDALGSEAHLKQGMRYFALQAAVNRDATTWVDTVKGLKPGADGWSEAVTQKARDISTALKADPLAMEQAISSAAPIDILHQFQYMFGDQPQVLARRGQGQAVLTNWADATTAIKDVTAADASVNTFTKGQGVWTSANQDALNSALEPFMQGRNIPEIRDAAGNIIAPVRAGGGGVPGSSYAFGEQIAGRLAEALGPDAQIALRRADNMLGSVQQIAPWKIEWDRLGNVAESLATRLGETSGGTVEAPKLLQVGDLNAAGVTNQVVRDPRLLGLTGAQIPVQAATNLLSHVTSRLDELKGVMNKYYEETAKMDPGELSSYSNKLAQQAARDVTLSDGDLQQRLLGLGYQPVALHPGAITLNHVGPGVADGLANAADVSPLKDFIGINKVRPDELSFMKTNATVNELGNLVKSGEVEGQSGRELMGRVWDTARAASDAGRDIPGTNLTMERHVSDLRQLSVKDFREHGKFTPAEAWQVYGAVRRGAAFGFDISRPIATARNLVDAIAYNGLPGIEDAIRTLVSLKPDTGVKWVDGPAGHILNLPDDLARYRDFVQFSMSPMFTAAKAFKTKILRGVEGLPFDFRPAERIKQLADESGDAEEFMARFNANYRNVMGESRGNALATLMDNPDFGIKNPGSGVFGHSNEPGIALDAWHMAQQARQEKGILGNTPLPGGTYQQIKDKVNGIYGYGPRSGLEKTGNYVFFPLSFDIKVIKALGGWALQNPARILAISLGLQAYNQANSNNAIGGFFDKYLPVLQEANKLNFFAGGFHTQLTPIGGRNTALWNLGKDARALIAQDPRLGAYVPISVSDNDLPSMLGMFANLLPMWRQMQTGEKALTSQFHSVTDGGADQWQVDNYYQTTTDLKKQVAISLGNAGLKPSFSTLTDTYGNMNPKVSPEFFNQVQAAIGQVEAKYPAGAAFAKAQAADYQHRSEALNELMRRPVKSRAEASVLYFAAAYYDLQAQAQSSARANASVSRAGRALYQQIAGDMAQGTTPPTLPGDLDAGQVAQLRRLALGLSQDAGPEFARQFNRLFRSELGPLSMYDQAPGVTGPAAGAA